MDVNDVFGQPEEIIIPETRYVEPAISPFDFVNAINYNKENLIVDDWSEKQYVPYIVNKALSYGADTVIPANEMNARPHLDKKLQFQFLINYSLLQSVCLIPLKAEKIDSIEVIKKYYGYSTEKAYQVFPLLNQDMIDYLKEKLEKGGNYNAKRAPSG